jgi:adenosylmethionine-8-amino-7-oxononanoate aminotransferase
MVGLELVAERETRRPFRRAARVTEAVVLAARRRGVLVYSGTGNADGVDGDTILLGPPFIVMDDELVKIADVLAEAVTEAVDGSTVGTAGRPG